MKVQDSKFVWVAWTNTDLTEGKGRSYPHAVCKAQATAIRLGKGQSVQGSNCYVTQELAVTVNERWLAPFHLHSPTTADQEVQQRINQEKDILEKALAAGLTEDDIKILRSNVSRRA